MKNVTTLPTRLCRLYELVARLQGRTDVSLPLRLQWKDALGRGLGHLPDDRLQWICDGLEDALNARADRAFWFRPEW